MNDSTVAQIEKDFKEQKHNADNIRKAFKDFINQPVWVVTDLNNRKVPIDPETGKTASITDPKTWTTFSRADEFCKKKPGFAPAIALSSDINLTCIDLDDVRNENQTLSWAKEMVQKCATYTEVSISGGGFHLFSKGQKPNQDHSKKGQIEIYDRDKFMTITGNVLNGHENIVEAQEAIRAIYYETFKKASSESTKNPLKNSPSFTDEEVIELCRKEKNPSKFTKLFDKGDLTENADDHSSSDLALCRKLAFYTQNVDQIDRIFRKSKLYRDKWEREDYRKKTIEKALESLEETYHPKQIKAETQGNKQLLNPVGLKQFLTTQIPEKPFILPWCREQNTVMIHAWRGVGKTLFSLNVGYAIASGGEFIGWAAEQARKVLYIDGEMPAIILQERLANIVRRNKGKAPQSDDYFQLLASDQQEMGIPYLDTEEGQALIQPFVEKADVIILDNLSTLTCQPENEAQAWLPMQKWMLTQRRAGKTIILIHHTGKGGAQRGSSKREDILDVVINLRRPKDYLPEQGARFELHFEKTRGITGKQVRPMEINVEEREGVLHWKHKELESAILDQIKELTALGMKDSEIWSELEISRATYFRYKKKLIEPQNNTEV